MLDDNNQSEEDSQKKVYTTKQYKFKFEKIKMQVFFDIDKSSGQIVGNDDSKSKVSNSVDNNCY